MNELVELAPVQSNTDTGERKQCVYRADSNISLCGKRGTFDPDNEKRITGEEARAGVKCTTCSIKLASQGY